VFTIDKNRCSRSQEYPSYPEARISYILEDTQTALVLTQRKHADRFKNSVILDDKPYQNESKVNIKTKVAPHDSAYVIYTSGTTGLPKGVIVEHRAFIFYQKAFNALVKAQQELITSFTLSYCFDASLPTLFSALISGGEVVITQDLRTLSSEEYVVELRRHHINTIRLTPSMLEGLLISLLDYKYPLIIVLGGECYNKKTVNALLSNEYIQIFNQYGPTECIVGSTRAQLSYPVQGQLIGKPYAGKRAYILDKQLTPVSVGAIGELYIGGAGLARGYLNQPKLTLERFIHNPFATVEDKEQGYTRLYKTGDLVRYLPDGNLEYIGRNDFQVKIRGYRIELGEIEHQFTQCPAVQQAVVIVYKQDEDNNDHTPAQLVAYYVSTETLDIKSLRNQLSRTLPDYMIPSCFMALPVFPMTSNGKLDRKALPKPDFTPNEQAYVAPRNDEESLLTRIWQEVLHVDCVGIYDDFYEFGGDSILAMQLINKLCEHKMVCRESDIFEHRCIANLLYKKKMSLSSERDIELNEKRIKSSLSEQLKVVDLSRKLLGKLKTKYTIQAIYPATGIQAYFTDYTIFGSVKKNAYQIPQLFEYKIPLNITCYQAAWKLIIETYPALRVCFNWDEELIQIVCKTSNLDFEVHNISSKRNKEKAEQAIIKQEVLKPFNLKKAPLLKVHLIHSPYAPALAS
jgi:amino acid adenylation domain-containing protein